VSKFDISGYCMAVSATTCVCGTCPVQELLLSTLHMAASCCSGMSKIGECTGWGMLCGGVGRGGGSGDAAFFTVVKQWRI